MPQNINVWVKNDQEELFFKTQRDARRFIGCNWETLKKAAATGKPVGKKKYTVRFEVEPYKPRKPREFLSFALHANVYLGLKIIAERRNKNVTVLMREAIFEQWPERYLWQLGADHPHGLKNVPYDSIGDAQMWGKRPEKWKDLVETEDRTAPIGVNQSDKSESDV